MKKDNLKRLFTLLAAFLTLSTWGNMASPLHEGTWMANPFISQSVDIIKEKILIIPDDRFETALFKIEYHIKADKSGRQIPFLFYASEFKESFRIWIDDKEIELHQVPEAYKELEGTPFTDFGYFFEAQNLNETKQVLIDDSPSSGFYVSIDDLKFFETDLTEGHHIIRVEYIADKWINRSNWVKEYSFRYALSPAKYWKSFGNLEITLDASNFNETLTTNLGEPETGSLQSKCVWTFSALPTEVLQITYKPAINRKASTLIAISPTGLTLVLAFILTALHIIAISLYRKKNPDKRFSWIMIAGSIVVPLLTLAGYMLTFDIIDAAIGHEASKYHGYTFLVIILYPILLPLYWIIMWLVDKTLTKKIREKTNSAL
jgi:hypothetical protein